MSILVYKRKSTMEFIKKIMGVVFTRPLRFIYKNGPGVFLLWEGISDESICYELTSVDSSFWKSNDETAIACSEIIERKSNAFIIAVYLLVGAYCVYTMASLLVYRYFFMSHLSAMSAMLADRIEEVHVRLRRPSDESSSPGEAAAGEVAQQGRMKG
jgi:hypothetical protein